MATVEQTASRLAEILSGRAGAELADRSGRETLVFEEQMVPRVLARTEAPADTWAVDGGQALVADARCLQVYVTRAATVRWQGGVCTQQEESQLEHHLLGGSEGRAALAASGAPVDAAAEVDVNLLRDWAEWRAVDAAVNQAEAGALILVDGDLQPDWRIASSWLGGLLCRAAGAGATLAGVTKHSSLSRGGAPLLGQLEREASAQLGPRAQWWSRVATTRSDVGPGIQVVAARLDPDAHFAFRIDLPADADVNAALGQLSALCDDAGFPGYPYPLSVADRLAACGSWVRGEVRDQLEAGFDRAGIPLEVRERAFADRHALMER